MTWPIVFANLAAGPQPLSDFDTMFNAVGAASIIACTASGSNAVVLTPKANYYTPVAYSDGGPVYTWVQQTTCTGAVTINAASLGALAAYRNNGATQIASGDLVAGQTYFACTQQSLNSNAGGFVVFVEQAQIPVVTVLQSGSGTYTTPTGARYLIVQMVGGGGGGSGSGAGAGSGGAGTATSFSSSSAGGGGGGLLGSGVSGGSASGPATYFIQGGTGGNGGVGVAGVTVLGGMGGGTPFGPPVPAGSSAPGPGAAGGGAPFAGAGTAGGGGGGGGFIYLLISSPAASYAYTVGAAGGGGTAGASGVVGGAGSAGVIVVTAYF